MVKKKVHKVMYACTFEVIQILPFCTGDGVENAFSYTNRVLTLSLHHYEVGYFPGTGRIQDVGYSRGKYHSVNVPLKSGVVDASFISMFEK